MPIGPFNQMFAIPWKGAWLLSGTARSSHRPANHCIEEPAMSKREFTIDELGFLQLADREVLAAVARGELDLNQLARREMANRGLDQHGKWVGFEHAARIHNIPA
jgi:hypothetical protein